MPTKITMPQLGESVSEGTIGHWLNQEGDMVKRDESLVEIITDKVTAELPSPVAGRLTKILVGDDQTVKVGVEIAEIEESGAGTATPSASAGAAAANGASNGATTASTASAASASTTPVMSAASPMTAVATPPAKTEKGPEKVSPLVRRMAQEHQIDLSQINGTGEGGRVRKEDIQAYLAQRSQANQAPSGA